MKKDAWLSWVVYTVSTASSYILGAAVLHPQGRVPEGSEVLTTISRIVTDTLGSWVGLLFLLLAALALFTTILADVPSLSRQIAASMAVFGLFDWGDRVARDRWIARPHLRPAGRLGPARRRGRLPARPGRAGRHPHALYLMAVPVATLYLSFRRTDPRVKDGRAFTAYLLLSAVAVSAVGALALPDYF